MPNRNSSYRGVTWDATAERWQAMVYIRKTRNSCRKRKLVRLGHFDSETEAAKAFDAEMDKNPYWHVLNFYPDASPIRTDRRTSYRFARANSSECSPVRRRAGSSLSATWEMASTKNWGCSIRKSMPPWRMTANRWGPKYMNFPDKYVGALPHSDGSSSNSSDEIASVGACSGTDGTPARGGRATGRSSRGCRSAARDAKRSNSTLIRGEGERSSRCRTKSSRDGQETGGSTQLSPSSTPSPSPPPRDGTASAAGAVGSRRGVRHLLKTRPSVVASSSSSSSISSRYSSSSSSSSSSTTITIKTMDHDVSTNDSTAGSSSLLTDTSSLAQPFIPQPTAATQSLDPSATNGSADTPASSVSAASQSPQSSSAQTSSSTVTEQLQSNGETLLAAAPSSGHAQRDVFNDLKSWMAKAWTDACRAKDPKATQYGKATCALHKASTSQKARIRVFVEGLPLDLTRSDDRETLVDMYVQAYEEGTFEE